MKPLHPSRSDFLHALSSGPLVFDGATGTMLYERGVFLTHSFDELNLKRPELVKAVHRTYADVGCQVIQTNTYGAHPIALGKYGLEHQSAAIAQAAVGLAREAVGTDRFVVGSVGPTSLLPKDLLRSRTRRAAFDGYRVLVGALCQAGVDALIFETFGYLGELEIAIEAAYAAQVPTIAQVTFDENGRTLDGAEASEVRARLVEYGVDVVGANCILGPERLLEVIEPLLGDRPVIMQPNAGHPRVVDGRAIYQSSPETFGVVARRAFKLGVAAIGGCCGTTPEHMRRVVAAARMMGGGRSEVRAVPPEPRVAAVPLAKRSRFGAKLARGEFVVSVEVAPPTGVDPTKTLERIRALAAGPVDAVNIPDGPRATVRMSNIALAKRVLDETPIEPIVHFCARDRNILGLQSDLLGAHALGIHNLVVITGDPPKVGDYPDATAVFDLDSIGMLAMAAGLNAGIDPAHKKINGHTAFVLATGAEPAALDFDREWTRLQQKRVAGAELIMTQPVYDPETLDRFLDAVAPLGIPVMVGVLPLASVKNARFLDENVPGMRIPPEVIARLDAADDARAEGIRIAAEALAAMKSRVQGAYIMPPFGRIEAALEVLAAAGIQSPTPDADAISPKNATDLR